MTDTFGSTSEDQRELATTVRAFLADRIPVSTLRSDGTHGTGSARPEPWSADSWKQLAGELGLTGLAVAEEFGGAGGTLLDLGVALEETGRALLPAPYLSTVVTAAVLSSHSSREESADLLPWLAEGSLIGAVALGDARTPWRTELLPVTIVDGRLTGTVDHVLDGLAADVLVVAALEEGTPGLFVVRTSAEGVHREDLPTLDQTRPQARIRFADTPAVQIATGADAVSHAQDLLSLALACEAVGSARAALENAVAHLLTRTQFGRALGSFQSLRHRVADLTVAVESASATAGRAAWAAVEAPAEFAVAAPLAKAVCSEALSLTAGECIQLLGGIGITWEHSAHLYLKRATATRQLGGSPRDLRRLAWSRAHGQAG
jgi:alkylation response protein AidB-like acyl-CoA dehydrogenase